MTTFHFENNDGRIVSGTPAILLESKHLERGQRRHQLPLRGESGGEPR